MADEGKTKAWNDFKARYPNADLSKFSAQVSFDNKRQATTEVYLNRSDGVQTSVQDQTEDIGMMIRRQPLELEVFSLNSL